MVSFKLNAWEALFLDPNHALYKICILFTIFTKFEGKCNNPQFFNLSASHPLATINFGTALIYTVYKHEEFIFAHQ